LGQLFGVSRVSQYPELLRQVSQGCNIALEPQTQPAGLDAYLRQEMVLIPQIVNSSEMENGEGAHQSYQNKEARADPR
jgi:hypothetical protein